MEANKEIIDENNRMISQTKPLVGIRKIIAERMRESLNRSPQFTAIACNVDVTNLVRLKEKYSFEGMSVSYTDLFIFIVSKALITFPELNSSLQNEKIIVYKSVNIGIAVATGKHLIVPVVKEVQRKNISQISAETKLLIKRTKNNELREDDLRGGTFTLTNLGMFNVDITTPILNPPEAAILGIGAIRKSPVVVNDKIEIKPLTTLSLTIDHAVADGATAAGFLDEIRRLCSELE